MDDYKIVYQMLGFEDKQVTEWLDRKAAYKEFERLKGSGKCVWAELQYDPLDEPEGFYGARVIEEFTNRVVDLFGCKCLVPV